jgi:hypothetical protein
LRRHEYPLVVLVVVVVDPQRGVFALADDTNNAAGRSAFGDWIGRLQASPRRLLLRLLQPAARSLLLL